MLAEECILTIVILNWNSIAHLKNCYDSLINNSDIPWKLIVVDNGSTDPNTGHYLCDLESQGVMIIRNTCNRGVAPGRNQGLREVRTPYFLILDVDTVVKKGALGKVVQYMERNMSVGIVGPKLSYPDGTLQLSCRRFPTLLGKIGRRIGFSVLGSIAARESLKDWDHKSVAKVDYVIGAAQFIRTSMYKSIGPLDEEIFYGPEDVDYCVRCWKAGWEVHYLPHAEIIHNEQRITRGVRSLFSKIGIIHIHALWYYFKKHGGCFSRLVFHEQVYK